MSTVKINELGTGTPESSDFLAFANPTTGLAEKTTIAEIVALIEPLLTNKADLNGNDQETFEVADATATNHAVSKGQLDVAVNNLEGALIPQGNWDASTNTPDITVTTTTGYYWIVSVDGSTSLGGITDWKTNDWAIKTATGWAKIDNSLPSTIAYQNVDNNFSVDQTFQQKINIGSNNNIEIYHDGTDNFIDINLTTNPTVQYAKLHIRNVLSGGGNTPQDFIVIDGLSRNTIFKQDTHYDALAGARFGANKEATIRYNDFGTTYMLYVNTVGDTYFRNTGDDTSIIIENDDGSGGIAEYIKADGSTGQVHLNYYGSNVFSTVSGGVDITGNVTANAFIGDGSQLTNIAQGGLPSNVAYTNVNNNFSVSQTINGDLTIGGGVTMGDMQTLKIGDLTDLRIYANDSTVTTTFEFNSYEWHILDNSAQTQVIMTDLDWTFYKKVYIEDTLTLNPPSGASEIISTGQAGMKIKHTPTKTLFIRPDEQGEIKVFSNSTADNQVFSFSAPSSSLLANNTSNDGVQVRFFANSKTLGGVTQQKYGRIQMIYYDIANNKAKLQFELADIYEFGNHIDIYGGLIVRGNPIEHYGSGNNIEFYGTGWDSGDNFYFRTSGVVGSETLSINFNDASVASTKLIEFTKDLVETNVQVRLSNLPTSSTGLSAGDLWNDGGTVKIV